MSDNVEVIVLQELKLVWFKGEGELHFNQIVDEVVALYAEPGFSGTFDTFFDMGDISFNFDTTKFTEEFGWFFETLKKRETVRRWIIFVKYEGALKAANEVAQLMDEYVTVSVFRERDKALECLGISEENLLSPPA